VKLLELHTSLNMRSANHLGTIEFTVQDMPRCGVSNSGSVRSRFSKPLFDRQRSREETQLKTAKLSGHEIRK